MVNSALVVVLGLVIESNLNAFDAERLLGIHSYVGALVGRFRLDQMSSELSLTLSFVQNGIFEHFRIELVQYFGIPQFFDHSPCEPSVAMNERGFLCTESGCESVAADGGNRLLTYIVKLGHCLCAGDRVWWR